MVTIALVSCVKSKLGQPAAAEDLYTSALFRAMRAYAQRNADGWYVLSAEHGLLLPHQVVEPYEKSLLTATKADRERWAQRVASQLATVLPAKCRIIFLAGLRYPEHLVPILCSEGHPVDVPLKGMRLGEQLRALKESQPRGR